MEYHLYTDGGCRGNPGKGGWGFYLITPDKEEIEECGYNKYTTNNQMEMTAVLQGLDIIPQDPSIKVIVYTDSVYVKNGITKWIYNWKKNNWQTALKKPVKNKELWVALDKLRNKYNIEWKWVRGHSNNIGNEKADQLANKAMDMIK